MSISIKNTAIETTHIPETAADKIKADPVLTMLKAALATLNSEVLMALLPEGFVGHITSDTIVSQKLSRMSQEEIDAVLPEGMNIQDEPTEQLMEQWVRENWSDEELAEHINDKEALLEDWISNGEVELHHSMLDSDLITEWLSVAMATLTTSSMWTVWEDMDDADLACNIDDKDAVASDWAGNGDLCAEA